MMQNFKISIVTRFMDRLHHLRQTLPTWLAIPQVDEIIIVDWDSRHDDLQAFVQPLNDGRIHTIRVNNQGEFNRGRALNTGIHYASGDFIFHIDADVILRKNPLLSVILNEFFLWRSTDRWSSLCGTCLFSKNKWYQVGGYAEFQHGWGHDDDYFHGKLYPLGVVPKFIPFECFEHIEHSEAESYLYHKIKNRWKSRELNVVTSAIIRKVYFDSLPVEITRPTGEKISLNFPVQFIEKGEPVQEMEKIYKTETVNKNLLQQFKGVDLLGPGFTGTPSHLEKSNPLPILSFPRPRRL